MTPRIFISYSSKDSETAKFIHDELTKRGADVFIDYRSFNSGDIVPERIAKEIKSRDSVLFLVSCHSVVSPWVQAEIMLAFNNRKPIVPLALDDSEIPDALFFVDLIHRRAFTHTDEDITRLCKVLGVTDEEKKDTSPPEDLPTPLTPPPSPPRIQGGAQTDRPNRDESAVLGNSVPTPAPSIKRASSLELMPQPFAWIDIPAGKFTSMRMNIGRIGLRNDSPKIFVPAFRIAKFPVTNAQYKVFVDAGGYTEESWWTEAGWELCLWEKWKKPRYWSESDFNSAAQPVVGISWYEAIAFCMWLNDATGEKIMLPTENQWQYAAQGADGREYPWGDQFDAKRCNTSESKIGKTTPVHQYEGKGDSPFGVVDMAGNVWEYCLNVTDTNINTSSVSSVMCGGSWDFDSIKAGINYRYNADPGYRNRSRGFRVLCVGRSN